ncbi:uncharacterized protein PHACADRAFT_249817 [Phanerochaete carnosa HHB-10118-sp]|uniref:Uncharacterized protein n=1 Tax=Phanerochaete carnosa (strain HHB-10118-sp) TaxID=650164 RepID=K5WJ28_PHACS|nr:uncharacterized protein PHACADRAFT_249817 [Phanerochaete carnosa HHB-10118-sp]EKM59370.1 hypothetical protein PHACADRAFT_249817 [Phanerochaete carnosa HHB-10118-sp]
MASAIVSAIIGGAIANLLVVYPHSTMTDAELKSELLVIKDWFIAFNSNFVDITGKLPSSTSSFPVAVMLATSDLHISTSSPNERVHITGRLSTEAAWALSPKENNCCVHIYAENNDIDDGYDNWLLKNKSRSKLSSPDIQAKVATALANNRGTLGKGNLA